MWARATINLVNNTGEEEEESIHDAVNVDPSEP